MYGTRPLPPILGPNAIADDGLIYFDPGMWAGSGRFSASANTGEFLNSTDNSGTVRTVAGDYGIIRLTPGTSAADYVSIMQERSAFSPASGRRIIFQTRIRTNDADDIKFFVGLCTVATGTSATVGPILDGVNDSIGFRNSAGGTTAFVSITEDDTSETTTAAVGNLADDTFITLTFELVGCSADGTAVVRFFVDGSQVAKHIAGIPDSGAALAIGMEVSSPTGTTATYLDYDYIIVAMDGGPAT